MTGVLVPVVPLLIIVTVGVATGWVGTMMVVTGGAVVTGVVTTGSGSVVKKLVVQALFEVPVTVLTLHQYVVLYFKVSLKTVALVGAVAL